MIVVVTVAVRHQNWIVCGANPVLSTAKSDIDFETSKDIRHLSNHGYRPLEANKEMPPL
jgi:hypothetical protein